MMGAPEGVDEKAPWGRSPGHGVVRSGRTGALLRQDPVQHED